MERCFESSNCDFGFVYEEFEVFMGYLSRYVYVEMSLEFSGY